MLLKGIHSTVWLTMQAPSTPAPSPSPEVLKALGDILKVAVVTPKIDSLISPERIQATAALLSAIAWPICFITFFLVFRRPIIDFLYGVQDVEFAGAKFKKLQNELKKAEVEVSAQDGALVSPSGAEQARIAKVEELIGETPQLARREAEALAYEYEKVRGSMPSSDERTRRMEVVVAKKRTIGRAVYPLRYELAGSPSPGKRLQAIAALQIIPDYEMLGWLAERPGVERPFVGYHAGIALLQAAKDPSASKHGLILRNALKQVLMHTEYLEADTDRMKAMREFEAAISHLP